MENGAQDFRDGAGAASPFHGWIEGEQLPEWLLVGHHLGPKQLGAGTRQWRDVQPKLPAKGGVGIVTQTLFVADGAEEQVEGPRGRLALTESGLANEPLIQPAELGGNLAKTLRNEELFVYHFLRRPEERFVHQIVPHSYQSVDVSGYVFL